MTFEEWWVKQKEYDDSYYRQVSERAWKAYAREQAETPIFTVSEAIGIVHDILKQFQLTKDFGRAKDYGATLLLGAIERKRRESFSREAGTLK